MLKAVLFDLDGSLLQMNEPKFVAKFAHLVNLKFANKGYDYDEISQVFWKAVERVYKNDGSKLNIDVFWDHLVEHYGEDVLKEKSTVEEYYNNEFKDVKTEFYPNPIAKEIVKFVNENNLLCILATQPIFPLIGVINRMDFVGLEESDFTYITNMENSKFTKANPKYYKDLLEKFNLKDDEVIMFGNHYYEDGESTLVNNIKTFLIEGCIIKDTKSTNEFEKVKMNEIIPTIKKYMDLP